MKKYIQPLSVAHLLQTESVIAASFGINDHGTDAEALSNHKYGWNSDEWSDAEEE